MYLLHHPGSHENIIAYFTSWFENEQLYIQMELCDHSLITTKNSVPKCSDVLEMLYQVQIICHIYVSVKCLTIELQVLEFLQVLVFSSSGYLVHNFG
jgi:hypothetical protein